MAGGVPCSDNAARCLEAAEWLKNGLLAAIAQRWDKKAVLQPQLPKSQVLK